MNTQQTNVLKPAKDEPKETWEYDIPSSSLLAETDSPLDEVVHFDLSDAHVQDTGFGYVVSYWSEPSSPYSVTHTMCETRMTARAKLRHIPLSPTFAGSNDIESRVVLLARKFADNLKFSEEDSARLAIATERVRKLLPQVGAVEYESLAEILRGAKQAEDDDRTIRTRFGL